MNRSVVTSLLLAATLAMGCATGTKPIDPNQVSRIRVGQTTQSQIRAVFGEPTDRKINSGGEVWVYRTGGGASAASRAGGLAKGVSGAIPGGSAIGSVLPSGGGKAPAATLEIRFDENGVVTKRDYQSSGG